MKRRLIRISKFISLLLRHPPEAEGLSMDEHGWVSLEALIATAGAKRRGITRDLLARIVADNDKKRFEFDEDGRRIRACQGHSRAVDLNLKLVDPPTYLYHGTSFHAVSSIRKTGLQKRNRRHVHLSLDAAAAMQVGARHGPPVVLTIRAAEMHQSGYEFFVSNNGIWLVDSVPADFIDFP
jgi:putative RNA 2'-phosphotransferase